ncbi:FKBP-type peptidyl-prolyl cis-trans isomerase [Sphingomonas quercus]|uniref:Peptidyl-prolyl cis-trans isomerase n=1 Tax=Sphingomonas quercus TaxID=2842451 RepID=A0ABS6BLN7_9SPHN|nr:FKBP-type peptidyl-prolyl cis-trans isomerase [Sphingomonas quercus]MBU3078159.1 FKBP-type peptidyl-prolyl cis-trans isomerase [Sphingomonas quercus]
MSDVTAVPLRPIRAGSITRLWVGVAALVLIGTGLAWAGTRGAVMAAMTPAEILTANAGKPGVITTPSGLQYKVLEPGKGARPTAMDTALVEYEGRLAATGKTFDSTAEHGGGPAPMPVGQMIPGFSEALQVMQPGGKYRVWIKPELGYGERDIPDPRTGQVAIPGNSVLVFDVTLLGVVPAGAMGGMPGGGAPGGM